MQLLTFDIIFLIRLKYSEITLIVSCDRQMIKADSETVNSIIVANKI